MPLRTSSPKTGEQVQRVHQMLSQKVAEILDPLDRDQVQRLIETMDQVSVSLQQKAENLTAPYFSFFSEGSDEEKRLFGAQWVTAGIFDPSELPRRYSVWRKVTGERDKELYKKLEYRPMPPRSVPVSLDNPMGKRRVKCRIATLSRHAPLGLLPHHLQRDGYKLADFWTLMAFMREYGDSAQSRIWPVFSLEAVKVDHRRYFPFFERFDEVRKAGGGCVCMLAPARDAQPQFVLLEYRQITDWELASLVRRGKEMGVRLAKPVSVPLWRAGGVVYGTPLGMAVIALAGGYDEAVAELSAQGITSREACVDYVYADPAVASYIDRGGFETVEEVCAWLKKE